MLWFQKMKLASVIIAGYKPCNILYVSKIKLLNVPFVIITLATLIGIVLGYFLQPDTKIIIIGFLVSIVILIITWQRSKKMFAKSYPFTIATLVFFVLFGIILVSVYNPKNNANHYTNQINFKEDHDIKKGIRFHVKERLKSSSYYHKYVVSVEYIESEIVKGNLLLQIPKDTINDILNIGDTYTTLAKIWPISKPLNPNQFDYAQYLGNHNIYHQITVLPHRLINNHETKLPLYRIADQIRKNINLKLSEYPFTAQQLAIINALLLGQRHDINQEMFNTYRDAGAIHILAVSGLHIGILVLILNLILKPLQRILKKGKNITLLVNILFLWCFAIIAGLSPSVLRAVTMFSFLAIGIQIGSQTSIYNSLFVSMFVLLCCNPLLLFSVGFQLSYLAVFSIVWIQPILVKHFRPRFFISKKLWETFTVTIAAQLGLLPLSIYYFHQFPLLFFVSNLIIIPFLGGILGLGIVVILFTFLEILPQSIANLFGSCIDFMNIIVGCVAHKEDFLITNISFSWRMLMISYVVIITATLLFKKYEKRRLYWVGIPIIILFLVLTFEKHTVATKEELVIFQHPGKTIVGVLQHQKFQLHCKDSISHKTKNFLLGNYLIQNQASLDTFKPLKNIYQYKEQTILVIDSTSIYALKEINPDIILLSNSPKIHLERVLDSLTPRQIIADGSNYKNYMDLWEASCLQQKIPFHRTDKKGAFILK